MTNEELNKLSVSELLELSENNTKDFRWDRSEIYKVAFDKYDKDGDKDNLEKMRKEILIFELAIQGPPNKRFNPHVTFKNKKGEESHFPDLDKHFPPESIEYYRERAATTINPILKSRYADFMWDIKQDVNCARTAIRAYLNCCSIYLANNWGHELADSLERDLIIATQINDPSLINESFNKHIEIIRLLIEKSDFRPILEIIRSILNQAKRISSPINYGELSSAIESAIADYTTKKPDTFMMQRSFMELLEPLYKLQDNKDELKNIKIRIAESFIQEADWKKEYQGGNMVAAHFYEEAMRVYIELGDFTDKVNELKKKITAANSAAAKTEFKVFSGKINIPKEHIERHLKIYEGLDPKSTFQAICADVSLIPSYEKAMESAVGQSKQFVFQHLIPVAIIKGNICVKNISGEEEKLEFGAINNFKMGYQLIAATILSEIFALLDKNHPDYSDSLIGHLSSSGIISPDRIALIKNGLDAYNDKKYVAAIHIFVFQIEGVLRDMLGLIDLPTFSYRNNEMRERMLSDILSTLMQIKGLDHDFLKLIDIFLNDIKGDNYRHDIAHGLLKESDFTRERAQLLLFILIKLASYTIEKTAPIKEGT